jgi:hypothetical protein
VPGSVETLAHALGFAALALLALALAATDVRQLARQVRLAPTVEPSPDGGTAAEQASPSGAGASTPPGMPGG